MNHSWSHQLLTVIFRTDVTGYSLLSFVFLVMLSCQCRWDKEMERPWSAVTDQFFKKAETPLNATFLQNASNFIFIHSTLYLKMSIERFKASPESCPISISLTYGCFHWPVFVLNTIHAVSRVFRGSSFARDQKMSPPLTVHIFRTNLR